MPDNGPNSIASIRPYLNRLVNDSEAAEITLPAAFRVTFLTVAEWFALPIR